MSQTEPWNIRSHDLDDKAALAHLSTVIYALAETLRICSILLQPYMPDRAAEALNRLGVSPSRRTFEYAVRGADGEYGQSFSKIESRGAAGSLFPPLASEEFPEEEGEPLLEQREERMPDKERKAKSKERQREKKEKRREKKQAKGKADADKNVEATGDERP